MTYYPKGIHYASHLQQEHDAVSNAHAPIDATWTILPKVSTHSWKEYCMAQQNAWHNDVRKKTTELVEAMLMGG